jgi:Rifampin ADP-ribosyl transferase/Tetratricopeptide repeat
MEFNPNNPVIQRCMQGLTAEENGQPEAAGKFFLQAWEEAANDFEKFVAAYYLGRHQPTIPGKLEWLETALCYALAINSGTVSSALPSLYTRMAQLYEQTGDTEKAEKSYTLAASCSGSISDPGPFYHGTRADLKTGDMLVPGNNSNYKAELVMNHIYFTAMVSGAGLAAALAKGEGPERVYMVEPTGPFEHDPNVTDKKFPGNPTRSYRTELPLKIVGEASGWVRQTPEQVQQWRDKLAKSKGEIIN